MNYIDNLQNQSDKVRFGIKKIVHYRHINFEKGNNEVVKTRNNKYIIKTILPIFAYGNPETNLIHKNKWEMDINAVEMWGKMMYNKQHIVSIRRKIPIIDSIINWILEKFNREH